MKDYRKEEKIVQAYTSAENNEEIYEMTFNCAEVVELMQIAVKNLDIPVVKHRFSTPEKMAEWLHNNYEEIALNNGWKTQDDCQVPFCDLPTENRLTMIELCIRYLNGA